MQNLRFIPEYLSEYSNPVTINMSRQQPGTGGLEASSYRQIITQSHQILW